MAETKRIAMITGSFDPVTSGHADLIRRAARMFDVVYVALMSNGEKDSSGGGMFTYGERLAMLEAACADLAGEGITNVKAELCVGLSSAYAAERGVKYIVRGVRSASDFDYEYSLAAIMWLCPAMGKKNISKQRRIGAVFFDFLFSETCCVWGGDML